MMLISLRCTFVFRQSSGAAAPVPAEWMSLLPHPSDMAVRPLIGNERIELVPTCLPPISQQLARCVLSYPDRDGGGSLQIPRPRFETRVLPFKALTAAQLLELAQSALEDFLSSVQRSLVSQASGTYP